MVGRATPAGGPSSSVRTCCALPRPPTRPIRPVHQLPRKMQLQRSLPAVNGSCQWYAASLVDNPGNYATALSKGLPPLSRLAAPYAFHRRRGPQESAATEGRMDVRRTHALLDRAQGQALHGRGAAVCRLSLCPGRKDRYVRPVAHCRRDAAYYYKLPYNDGRTKYTYVVTALDRLQNESKPPRRK